MSARRRHDRSLRATRAPGVSRCRSIYPFTDKLAWSAYVNAGVRVVDISDPYHLTEVPTSFRRRPFPMPAVRKPDATSD